MLCGFREVSRFVKTTCIHLKQATYLHCTVEIGQFALYPVRLKSISDPFKNIRNETIYQCEYIPRKMDGTPHYVRSIYILTHCTLSVTNHGEDAGGLVRDDGLRIPSVSFIIGLLVSCVTSNDTSVIYVTAQMCRRTEEKVVPTVGLQTP